MISIHRAGSSVLFSLVRCASLLVPKQQRADWLAEWKGELAYVLRTHERGSWFAWNAPAGFCFGALSDALWIASMAAGGKRHPGLPAAGAARRVMPGLSLWHALDTQRPAATLPILPPFTVKPGARGNSVEKFLVMERHGVNLPRRTRFAPRTGNADELAGHAKLAGPRRLAATAIPRVISLSA